MTTGEHSWAGEALNANGRYEIASLIDVSDRCSSVILEQNGEVRQSWPLPRCKPNSLMAVTEILLRIRDACVEEQPGLSTSALEGDSRERTDVHCESRILLCPDPVRNRRGGSRRLSSCGGWCFSRIRMSICPSGSCELPSYPACLAPSPAFRLERKVVGRRARANVIYFWHRRKQPGCLLLASKVIWYRCYRRQA